MYRKRTAQDTVDTADATLMELDDQGSAFTRSFLVSVGSSALLHCTVLTPFFCVEKIARAQDGVARINDRMNSADRLIYEIGSFWGNLVGKFRSTPNTSEHQDRRQQWEAEHEEYMQAQRAKALQQKAAPLAPSLPPRSTEDDEYDRDLTMILESVQQMKSRALEMGIHLEEHNRRLDALRDETDIATDRVRKGRGDIATLLR